MGKEVLCHLENVPGYSPKSIPFPYVLERREVRRARMKRKVEEYWTRMERENGHVLCTLERAHPKRSGAGRNGHTADRRIPSRREFSCGDSDRTELFSLVLEVKKFTLKMKVF